METSATPDASVVLPSMNVTVPVGAVVLLPGIVAVSTTVPPMTGAVGEDVSVVVVVRSK